MKEVKHTNHHGRGATARRFSTFLLILGNRDQAPSSGTEEQVQARTARI